MKGALGPIFASWSEKTVEDTLNGPLEAEADELVGAGRYERTAEREAYRAGLTAGAQPRAPAR